MDGRINGVGDYPDTRALGLIPLVNFGEIVPGIYRSAQPQHQYQWDWLGLTLELDVAISLRAENGHMDDEMAHQALIGTLNIPVVDHKPPTDEQALEFMRLIKRFQSEGKSVLIHCAHGHGRTSTFSVLAKMASGFVVGSAIMDERVRFHYEFKHPAQLEWLRDFERRQIDSVAKIVLDK